MRMVVFLNIFTVGVIVYDDKEVKVSKCVSVRRLMWREDDLRI